jgi:hypothetical protein
VWSEKNIDIINKAKESTGFVEPKDIYSIWAKLTWWKVYLKVRSLVPSTE